MTIGKMGILRRLRIALVLFCAIQLSACASRPLSINEVAFLGGNVQRQHIDYRPITIHKGLFAGISRIKQEGLFDQILNAEGRLVSTQEVERRLSGVGAITLYSDIYWKAENYSEEFCDPVNGIQVDNLSLLAHEVTHVWQWQQRESTGYTPLKAILERFQYSDPYAFRPLEPAKSFLAYRFEQQGAMVQEYVKLFHSSPDSQEFRELDALIRAVWPLHRMLKNLKLI